MPQSLLKLHRFVNLDDVENLIINNNNTTEQMLFNESYFDEAKSTDLDNWKSKKVYKEIFCQNQ